MSQDSGAQPELPSLKRLWGGWMLSAFAWAAHLMAGYSLVEWYCRNREVITETTVMVLLNGLTALCFVAAMVSAWLARGASRSLTRLPPSRGRARSHFMARFGLGLSLFFALVILAQALPVWMLQPCMR